MNHDFIGGAKLAEWSGGKLVGSDWEFNGFFQVDSRKIQPGDIFVALAGKVSDGHSHISEAFDRGAVGAFVDSRWFSEREYNKSRNYILFEDVEQGLISLAQKRLSQVRWALGITGSVGKTTVREMVYKALSSDSRVYRARNSHNTLIGCALTLSEMPIDTEGVILEMGTNHPGEIAQMVDFFPIHMALITKVAPAHLEGLGGLEGVIEAKMEILRSRALKKAIIGAENLSLIDKAGDLSRDKHWDMVSVGEGAFDYEIINKGFSWNPVPSVFCDLKFSGGQIQLKADVFGEHNSLLLALAFGVAAELGEDPQVIAERLSSFKAFDSRGRISEDNGVILIDESYNANPESMMALLSAVESSPVPIDRRFILLGEMGELGDSSEEYHKKILNRAALLGNILLFGSNWSSFAHDYPVWSDLKFLGDYLKGRLSPGDLLVVKGSRSNGLERIWGFLR
ncbi:UDP-N-acetylmuramoyl-tripeptide--D-alanyl-D-alanine ligase [Dethiosulfovibrio salsuginis]|uniref:UDP-N-acetylmuramoyl-tripeptide--D-alanyl-D-alanine ligase n=1 Tax=Dethiosulfovibrio salsuginis TaxID=561720 RepID=A0A1X7I681_9BACT|nr:UDP-N-acetylmuramoyl-tripeptide--D-alanyl-D-alanine ligase [Dethiosulfovibrio salsuginis]SMG10006.1 UDP-N-acetylmuramoyl-tripeptide--D-alanyl-D-alanine ligase [Dethiosulfovibrio salsuginis]